MFKKIVLVTIMTYLLGYILAFSSAQANCVGWQCEVVYCPKGYAVEVPGKGMLPCAAFDAYVESEDPKWLLVPADVKKTQGKHYK